MKAQLAARQLPSGGWGFRGGPQAAIEPSALALLALRSVRSEAIERAALFLQRAQNLTGAWPSFPGCGDDNCWSTALAVLALPTTRRAEMGCQWLLRTRGRESQWPWRWKFRLADTKVALDPDKYGWPWIPETNSWVVPTAASILALKRANHDIASSHFHIRIALGEEMLADRACTAGGWNAGNPMVYGVTLNPHLDATAIAILALLDNPVSTARERAVRWLLAQLPGANSVFSLSWAVLAAAALARRNLAGTTEVLEAAARLERLSFGSLSNLDSTMLALATLALAAVETESCFEVPRWT